LRLVPNLVAVSLYPHHICKGINPTSVGLILLVQRFVLQAMFTLVSAPLYFAGVVQILQAVFTRTSASPQMVLLP